MKPIALAILSVGLCFYQVHQYKHTHKEDATAALVAIVAAIALIFFT